MSKNSSTTALTAQLPVDESSLFSRVAEIIETCKTRAGAYANREITLMYWEIGRHINSVVLGGERAEYGKRIFSALSRKLVEQYGRSFELRNLRRMVQFSELFPDFEIVSPLATQLSWSHFVEILPLNDESARLYYAKEVTERHLSTRELRRQISRKAYERQEIANTALTVQSAIPFNVFKDPYLLDTLGLKDNYLEADSAPLYCKRGRIGRFLLPSPSGGGLGWGLPELEKTQTALTLTLSQRERGRRFGPYSKKDNFTPFMV